MKAIIKKTMAAAAAVLAVASVSAQDFDGFDSFDGGFGDAASSFDTAEPSVVLNGTAETSARVFPQREDKAFNTHDYDLDLNAIQNKAVSADGSFTLGVSYSGASADFDGKLKFNESILNNYREDILQEFTARVYLGNFQLEAGKMKVVWGKGDKVHVLDNFNSNDYTDFIIPDYLDRRIALPMFHAVYNVPVESCLRLEAVYTPYMVADRLASDGMWKPGAAAALTENVTASAKASLARIIEEKDTAMATATLTGYAYEQAGKAAAANPTDADAAAAYQAAKTAYEAAKAALTAAETSYNLALSNVSGLSSDPSVLYPDTYRLKYGQAGLRATWTLGSVDLGLSYYYGHYKQPSFNAEKFNSAMAAYAAKGSLSESEKFLSYDQLQVFGLEAATVIGPFNLESLGLDADIGPFNTRAEVAYNLTKDIDGDDPWVRNNSIAWEFGFDINLPVNNVNVNFQTTGKYILHNGDIEDGAFKTLDVDYDGTGYYTRNQLILDITDTYNYEKIKLDLKGIYQIETKDLMVLPSISFTLADTFTLNLSGLYIWCADEDDSEYYAWRNNDFVSVGFKYQF